MKTIIMEYISTLQNIYPIYLKILQWTLKYDDDDELPDEKNRAQQENAARPINETGLDAVIHPSP